MSVILGIIIGILFAIQDWAWLAKATLKHLHKFSYNFYNRAQHYSKILVVLLIPVSIYFHFINDLKDVFVFFLSYYVAFEPTLNLLREKSVFYLSKTGSSSDSWRIKIFGKEAQIFEALFKFSAILLIFILITQ